MTEETCQRKKKYYLTLNKINDLCQKTKKELKVKGFNFFQPYQRKKMRFTSIWHIGTIYTIYDNYIVAFHSDKDIRILLYYVKQTVA